MILRSLQKKSLLSAVSNGLLCFVHYQFIMFPSLSPLINLSSLNLFLSLPPGRLILYRLCLANICSSLDPFCFSFPGESHTIDLYKRVLHFQNYYFSPAIYLSHILLPPSNKDGNETPFSFFSFSHTISCHLNTPVLQSYWWEL